MIFKGYANTIVWDAQSNKALCQFMDGIFETNSVETIEKLKELGYEYEPVKDQQVQPKKEIKEKRRK